MGTATETRVGWVLSGPVKGVGHKNDMIVNVMSSCATHSPRLHTQVDATDEMLQAEITWYPQG